MHITIHIIHTTRGLESRNMKGQPEARNMRHAARSKIDGWGQLHPGASAVHMFLPDQTAGGLGRQIPLGPDLAF